MNSKTDLSLSDKKSEAQRSYEWGQAMNWMDKLGVAPAETLWERVKPLVRSSTDAPPDAPTVAEIEEYRRENLVTASQVLAEPWAQKENRILNYLCYRACAPLASQSARGTTSDDTARLDWLQSTVEYVANGGRNHEASAYLDNHGWLDTALIESEGDLRKAIDAVMKIRSPDGKNAAE